MQENKSSQTTPQNIFLENRKKLSVSGVTDVSNFDENIITMYTTLGQLTIKGRGMHVASLSLETGDVEIEGEIIALGYSDNVSSKVGFVSRLFK
jgi:sporulation protein YabP